MCFSLYVIYLLITTHFNLQTHTKCPVLERMFSSLTKHNFPSLQMFHILYFVVLMHIEATLNVHTIHFIMKTPSYTLIKTLIHKHILCVNCTQYA